MPVAQPFKPEPIVDRPFAPPIETIIDMPPPPSVNETRKMYGPGSRLLAQWRHQAGMRVLLDGGMKRPTKMPGQFEATVILCERQCRCDLDNAVKAVIDYAKILELIIDDGPRYMRRVTIEWGEAPQGARLILRSVTP